MISTNDTKKLVFDQHGHRVASIVGDVCKRSIRNKHLLRCLNNAVAFDLHCIKQIQDADVRLLEVYNQDTKQTWKCPFLHFLERAKDVNFGKWGPQKALPENGWIKESGYIQGRLL